MGLRNFPLSVARFILKKLDDSFSLQKSFEHFEFLRFTCSIKHTVIGEGMDTVFQSHIRYWYR